MKDIKTRYRYASLTSRLGEIQIIHYTRLDRHIIGYEKGATDIELTCKFGEYTYVVAIELKTRKVK